MADFTPINTQEEFDKAISARLKRERETVTSQLQTQLSEYQQKTAQYEESIKEMQGKLAVADGQASKITELEAKIKGYETASVKTRIAREVGLPAELADRISGEDENAMRTDAESLKKLMGVRMHAPLKSTEDVANKDKASAAWGKVVAQMKGD